tara:strand:+ start:212950 stop:213102 length:153 start_codon:yes stop_codon:yes gene_type:complete
MSKLWLYSMLSIILAVTSGVLAYNQITGWGWFLFGAIATFVYPSSKDSDD